MNFIMAYNIYIAKLNDVTIFNSLQYRSEWNNDIYNEKAAKINDK